jgi:nucleoid DNA-binding protein
MITYKHLLQRLSVRSGFNEDMIALVMKCLMEILRDMPRGESARTPLGTFKMYYRRPKRLNHPITKRPTVAPSEMVLKFRAGGKTRRTP